MTLIQYQTGILRVSTSASTLPRSAIFSLLQLGFTPEEDGCYLAIEEPMSILRGVKNTLKKNKRKFQLCDHLAQLDSQKKAIRKSLVERNKRGLLFKKSTTVDSKEQREFLQFLKGLPRQLKGHQVKAATHLLEVKNGANFSVPGSGKTTVVLAVYEWLRRQGLVDSIFVVGPPSCFEPWRSETTQVINRKVETCVLTGGDPVARKQSYLGSRDFKRAELYLTSFQTLQNDVDDIVRFFKRLENRVFLVLDEAHYIKKQDGAWANAALNLSDAANFRCILTGTPFPRDLTDAFNLFEFLWPDSEVFNPSTQTEIKTLIKEKRFVRAAKLIDGAVSGLFYRVRKSDLQLADQVFHKPIKCKMNPTELEIYHAITSRINALEQFPSTTDSLILKRLRQGRMTRLRQCVSNAALLTSVVDGYGESLFEHDSELLSKIKNYGRNETPNKLFHLDKLVDKSIKSKEKLIIWSNFIGTIELIYAHLKAKGIGCRKIYGQTPFELESETNPLSREAIIREFNEPSNEIRVLIANPAACAEAVSLHKACSIAVYYDLSYNCAQFIQSQDRIHRVGGSEQKSAEYYFLQYENTIDENIFENLNQKRQLMSTIVDQEYPVYSLDMYDNTHSEDLEVYGAAFPPRSL